MNNIKKLEQYIHEFDENIKSWLYSHDASDKKKTLRITWLKDKTGFFKKFFEQDFKDLNENKIKTLAKQTHSLSSIGLAIHIATSNFDKTPIQQYQKTFKYLSAPIVETQTQSKYDIIGKRLQTVLNNKEYKLYGWGIGAISELIGYIFPNDFVFFNHRNRAASDYLNLQYNDKGSKSKRYVSFQKDAIKPFFQLYIKPNLTDLKDIPIGLIIDQFFNWTYDTKIKNNQIDKDLENVDISIGAELKKITVKNYHSLHKITLPKLSKEVYIVGENGVGKTLLLQAIFWVIKNLLIENDPSNTLGTAWIKRNFNNLKNLDIKLETNEIENNIYQIPIANKNNNASKITYKRIQNFFAYGVNRQYQKGNDDTYEFMSLFNSEVNTSLKSPMIWLQSLKFMELEMSVEGKNYTGLKLDTAIAFLEELLENNLSIIVSSANVIFHEKESKIQYSLLSDGYKSMFTWLADLLARLSQNQPNVDSIKEFEGVVLIDELDLYLHPKWSYRIVEKLRTKLPKIQFIITTHSPILILGASKDAVFYKMYKEDGISKISPPMHFNNLTANSLITSPIWGMDAFAMRGTPDDKISDANFMESRLDEAIQQQLKEKPIFSDEETLKIIKAELDKI